MVHSHSCIDSQIFSSFGTLQALSDLADKYLKHDQEEFEVFSDIVKWSNIPKFCVSISRESYAVGVLPTVKSGS